MARATRPFDEIMIVNPIHPRGGRAMRFYSIQEDDETIVGYVELPAGTAGGFGDPPPGFTEGFAGGIAYVADDPAGDEVAYVAEDPYGGEMAYVAEEPVEGMRGLAAEEAEVMGYVGAEDELAYVAEDEGEVEGYVREDREPPWSPRVIPGAPLAGVEGYVTPKSINPTAESIRPAEVVSEPASQWFKPHW